jgi:dTDP-4-amino-4,6-dideoxy-D-galactose acyltransferase
MISHLDWDSKFFGYPVGCIRLPVDFDENLLAHSLRDGRSQYRLIYIFSPESIDVDQACFSEFPIIHADTRVVYEKELLSPDYVNLVDTGVKKIVGQLDVPFQDLALESGSFSRFRTDENFELHSFRRLYLEWLRRSLNGEIADACYALYNENVPAGLITIKLNAETGTVGLLAVDAKHRCEGIGRKLLYAAEKCTLVNHGKKVSIPTQEENIGACRFYESSGYTIASKTKIYHCWNHEFYRFQ